MGGIKDLSGPKTSRYSLTPEQRRILEEQLRKRREEAIRKEKLLMAKKSFKDGIDQIRAAVQKLTVFENQRGIDEEVFKEIEDYIKTIDQEIENIKVILSKDDLQEVKGGLVKVRQVRSAVQKQLIHYAKLLNEAAQRENEEQNTVIAQGFESAVFAKEKVQDKQLHKYKELIQDELGQLDDIFLSDELALRFQEISTTSDTISDGFYLENYYLL